MVLIKELRTGGGPPWMFVDEIPRKSPESQPGPPDKATSQQHQEENQRGSTGAVGPLGASSALGSKCWKHIKNG